MYKIFITCQAGLESLVKRDSAKAGLTNITVADRSVSGEGSLEIIYSLLIWSRFANRVYIELANQKITDFDALFEVYTKIPWEKFISERIEIVTEATSIRSQLSHLPSIQSISKKAIIESLKKNNGGQRWDENRGGNELHIQSIFIDDMAHVLLDITGLPLHKRGWRQIAGEAPIKENLAAALVALSGWRFKEVFWDGFCGSGTIAIEAAMLARNIAPGKNRYFSIQHTKIHDEAIFQAVKSKVSEKEYPSGKYKIFASDSDEAICEIAKKNAFRAGVDADITFSTGDFEAMQDTLETPVTFVANPPYGVRLENEDLDALYESIFAYLSKEAISGGVITSFESKKYINFSIFKNRKLYNGNIESRFWYRKK